MSDGFLGPKPVRSTAAFLWMPQFSRSFRQLSYLGPVFVHILASVFVSAGLLPRNHPALMYGVDGVRKYGVRDIIGEAWFTLRRTNAAVNQWGIFIGVMLMMAMMIGAIASFLMAIAFGAGNTAQAQLFSHPRGDSSFGNNGYNTDPTADPFDRAIPPADTVAGDYGIMMLDKVIRAGANGQGGALQRATQDLMLIYNSGIMVIASVIIFWMIINIVVDTAKTGQVGGGRHNMVWLPIRLIFALGLLIPLGSNGFSSGQYMVMKLAEWGSNFGTRAWAAYVQGVTTNTNLIASGEANYAGEAVISYTKMWLCRISVNANLSNGNSGSFDEYVTERTETRRSLGIVGSPIERTVNFDRSGSRGLCGSLTFPLRTAPDSSAVGLDRAIKQMEIDTSRAFYTRLREVEPQIIDFACDYARGQNGLSGSIMANARTRLGAADYAKVIGGSTLAGWSDCASKTADASARPGLNDSKQRLQNIVNDYQNRVSGDYNTAMRNFRGSQGLLIDEMTARGWAGMGVYYHRIGQMNAAVAKARRAANIITVGNMEEMKAEESGWLSSLFGNDNQWITDTQGTLTQFQNWWTSVPEASETTAATKGSDSRALSIADMKRDPLGAVTKNMGFDSQGIISILSSQDDLTASPLAVVSSIGDWLIWAPLLAYAGFTIAQVIISAIGGFATGGGISVSIAPIFNMISGLLVPVMLAGVMLKYYLPLIPFIRVLFSVLTWIISVFEAVIMVPIAALAHLSSQGEGLAVGTAESAWKLWLNILLRPILTVIGFVGAMLVFNAFASYVNATFADMYKVALGDGNTMDDLVNFIVFALLYAFIMYTVANTVFKMLDLIPDALGRWYGVPKDQNFADNDGAAFMAAQLMGRVGSPKMGGASGRSGGGGNGAGMGSGDDGGGGSGGGGSGGGGGGGGEAKDGRSWAQKFGEESGKKDRAAFDGMVKGAKGLFSKDK